ncbi:MAG: hypothetical protein LBV18_04860 [Alistipes sp.]|jgi:dipeptide/tripeptide permease|nr:hypothetical protein [Alistipes sp.]
MEAKLIEKLDRRRYRAMALMVVAQVMCLILSLTAMVFKVGFPRVLFGLSLLLLAVSIVWFLAIKRRIGRDKDLRAALRNEMYETYNNLSQRIAFVVVMCALSLVALSYVLSVILGNTQTLPVDYLTIGHMQGIPLAAFFESIFWLGLLAFSISWLVLNRNRK